MLFNAREEQYGERRLFRWPRVPGAVAFDRYGREAHRDRVRTVMVAATRLAVFAMLLMVACTPTAKRGATFLCAEGTAVEVEYGADDVATVRVGERPSIRLERAISGSGARYSDGRNEIWEAKGKLRVKLSDGTDLEACERR